MRLRCKSELLALTGGEYTGWCARASCFSASFYQAVARLFPMRWSERGARRRKRSRLSRSVITLSAAATSNRNFIFGDMFAGRAAVEHGATGSLERKPEARTRPRTVERRERQQLR